MSVQRGIDGLKRILGELDFPVDKEGIVVHAQDSGADEELLSALQSMPPAQYNEPNEVLRSVPVPESGDARTESARAQQKAHPRAGLSESMRDTGPVNPIEEELGENRKA